MIKWTLWAPVALAGYFFSLTAYAQTISVEGRGTAEIDPEYASLGASVSHTANTALAAQALVDEAMANLLEGLADLPIDADSIAAGQLRIAPRYRWNPRTEAQEFQGYEATRDLGFQLLLLEALGEALQSLAERGATSINAPVYGSSQVDAARAQALALAYAKARSDADALATAAGLALGAPDAISSGSRPAPVFRAMDRAAPAAMSVEMAPRYEPGRLSVSASVLVTFSTSR
ncbi:MAG: SIMPL domain-containing protein [Luminiphilus sp.]|jgi:uncharacterized protein|nr:SIMPL domain-containing protein [Luminiphilus sp.]